MQENLASMGALTSGIAHELKNPLNFINNFAALSVELSAEAMEALRSPGGLGDGGAASLDELLHDLQQNAAKIRQHGERADGIVRGMLDHARGGAGTAREVAWNALVQESARVAWEGSRGRGEEARVELTFDLDEAAGNAIVLPEGIGRVVINLVTNAIYAARAKREAIGASFAPAIVVATRAAADAVEVTVRDNGDGIPAAARDKVFMPFFTTKPPGEGVGLGLSLSHEIVAGGHGGEIRFETEEGRFTEFCVRVPRRRAGF
jgi:signal transduction histidine kinase